MNFLPERPKAIIRKYEQIETREELKAACEEIADQISEKQKQRSQLHDTLGTLLNKKETMTKDITALQHKLKDLTNNKFPKLQEKEDENNLLEKKLLNELQGIGHVESEKEIEIRQLVQVRHYNTTHYIWPREQQLATILIFLRRRSTYD